jgi:hypothetical protein
MGVAPPHTFHCHPACPEERRERSAFADSAGAGAAFSYVVILSGAFSAQRSPLRGLRCRLSEDLASPLFGNPQS